MTSALYTNLCTNDEKSHQKLPCFQPLANMLSINAHAHSLNHLKFVQFFSLTLGDEFFNNCSARIAPRLSIDAIFTTNFPNRSGSHRFNICAAM